MPTITTRRPEATLTLWIRLRFRSEEVLECGQAALQGFEPLHELLPRLLPASRHLRSGLLPSPSEPLASAVTAARQLVARLATPPRDLVEQLGRALARDRDRT